MPSLPWGAGELEQELCTKTEWDVSPSSFSRNARRGEAIPEVQGSRLRVVQLELKQLPETA